MYLTQRQVRMNSALFSVENLSIFTQSQKIVKNISFSINQGEIFALVGESGSGKSLTALSVVDLLAKNLKKSGKITYKGTDLSHSQNIQKFRGSEIAFIFQDPTNSLNPIMTIGEQVNEVLALHTDLGKKQRKSRVLELFKQVDLDDTIQMYTRYPHQVSGRAKTACYDRLCTRWWCQTTHC